MTRLPAGAEAGTSGNLPIELTTFVGRGQELAEVKRLLATARIITLTGAGGIGKSRLALRAARRLDRRFPDGMWWVDLAELDAPEQLTDALARALGVREQRGTAIEDTLRTRLRGRRLLVILDNCEHLLDACRTTALAIVAASERARLLCTSRQRLDVAGEAVVVVSTLGVQASGGGESDALQLLVDRASAVAGGFALTDENSRAASDICERLDGLPLAIELAAVRLASMTANDLLERLDDRLRLLTASRPRGPSRSQALRATVDWSYDLLVEEERILWRRLSVFAGSFDLRAAEEVCSGAGVEREHIVMVIGSLVDKSILTMRHERRHGRYRFLETLRLYGSQRLDDAGEAADLADRHAAWFAQLISGEERPMWASNRQAQMFDLLDVEWANVDAALDWYRQTGPGAERGLRMAADLWLYWVVRGRYRFGRRRLEALLAQTSKTGPHRVMALWAIGFLAQAAGDMSEARAAFEEAHAIADRSGDDRELAYALMGVGLFHQRLGNAAEACDWGSRSRGPMLRADDPMGLALSDYFYAAACATTGRLDEARRHSEEGLAASRRAGDVMARGILNALLGAVEWQLGDIRSAEGRLKEALRLQLQTAHVWGMIASLEGLAWVAGSLARFEQAAMLLGAATALAREYGNTQLAYGQAHHDACDAAARAALGDVGYEAAWERGHILGYEQMAAIVLDEASAEPALAPSRGPAGLTSRELEVARLVAQGLSNPAIAATLFISVATVKTHVSHVLEKLLLDSRVQIAAWIAEHDR